jgi:hypothetical protein
MTVRGKQIFGGLLEYPLPKQTGVRDYIFYFVARSDPYGNSARYFFERFYKNHVSKNVSSLEQLIEELHQDVTGGVTLVREVVIVAHGTPLGLVLPVLKGTSDTNLREYRYLTPFSLAFLQQDFIDKKLRGFEQKRKEVVARLKNESWITIRACRFGASADGMYALYSFFGGRANVYAPKDYQFFGTQPLIDGMRVETKLDAHKHVVKQRFLPRDLHTPERKDAVVRFLVDPAKFSEAFTLASTSVETPAAEYEGLIDALNARTIPAALRTKMAELGHPLSGRARVTKVIDKDSDWIVTDLLEHEGTTHTVEYDIGEEVDLEADPADRVASLIGAARIASAYSASEFFPLQLFFNQHDNDGWRGKLFELAFYAEPPPPDLTDPDGQPAVDPALKQRFDAVLTLLRSGRFSDGTIDLKARFKEEGHELSEVAVIRQLSQTGSGPTQRVTWVVQDAQRFLIRLEHPPTDDGTTGHTLTVYSGLEGKARLLYEYEQMRTTGRDPDTPGTELAAYLDRFSLPDLVALIDFLRSPYRAEHSFYIHHTQQAIGRKKESHTFFQEHLEQLKNQPLVRSPYGELDSIERDDKNALVHDFDFNEVWQEVRASHHSLGTFNDDLFVEENLWKKLRRKEDLADRGLAPEVEPESPAVALEELRALEKAGVERYFSTDKFIREGPPETEDPSCAELKEALLKLKELQGTDSAEIERLLELQKTASGKSFLDYVKWVYDKFQTAKIGLDLMNISFMTDGIVVKIVEKIPLFAPSALGIPSTAGILMRVAPAITIPLTMWLKFLEGQQQALEAEFERGKRTAIRQWLRALARWTTSPDFPHNLDIPMDKSQAIQRYFNERVIDYNDHFQWIFSARELKDGFEVGLRLIEQAGPEIAAHADEVVADLLREFQIEPCKLKVLKEVGIIDIKAIKGKVIRKIVDLLLNQVPRVG